MTDTTTKIPSHAIDGKDDLIAPVTRMLQSVYLLGTPTELKESGAAATFKGSPASVAVIEASATALGKWWGTGGSALLAIAWGWAGTHWPKNETTERTLILSLAIFSSALVLAVGYLFSSDVRGRAVASAATIGARAEITDTVIKASLVAATRSVIPLTKPFYVAWLQGGDLDRNWLALAVEGNANGDDLKFLIQRQTRHEWVSADDLSI